MAGSTDSKTIVTIFKNQYIGSPEVAKFVADLLAAQAAQDKLNKTQKESSKISKDQQKIIRDYSKDMQQFAKQQEQLMRLEMKKTNEQKMAAAAQEKAQAQIVASQRKQQIAHTQSLFDSVYAQQKATSAWEQGGAAARTFGRDIFYMSVQIAAAATALAVMTSANVEFERAMAKVGTMLSTANKSWIDTYRKGILDLSQETGKSAKDIAGAMYEILSAAIPPRQAMEILKGGSTLAVAGFVDLKDAINPIITTLNVYKMTSADVGDITDKMFAALERGVFDMQQFSTQFGDIAATAKSAGVSFEELLAVISLLTRNGLQMNEAVTATQGLLKTFINPTREATIAMRDYSRYNKDLTLQLNSNYVAQKGIIEVIKEFGKLSTQERNNIIGRIEGIKALTILVGKEGELRKDLTNIMNSQGKASVKEAEVKKNVAIQVDQVVQGIKRLGIEYGKISFPLAPFKAVLTYFNNISDSMKTFIGTTGQAVIVIGTLASTMAILRSAFAALSASMIAIRGVNTALYTGFLTYQTLLPTISRAMGPLGFAGAIGAAALAAEGLAQWLTWLHDNSDWLDKYLGVSPEKMLKGLSLENQYQELLLKRKQAVDKLADAYIREGLSADEAHKKAEGYAYKLPEDVEPTGQIGSIDVTAAGESLKALNKVIQETENRIRKMPPLRIKLDARELERIKISSGEENMYAAKKRLIEEISASRSAAEMAKGRGSAGAEELSTNINNEIALRKELLQVEKSIAAEEKRLAADRERERKAALAHQEKAQDFVARFREQLASEQEQNLKKVESIEKQMIESAKFEWEGYYQWKRDQLKASYEEAKNFLTVYETDDKKQKQGLEANEIAYITALNEHERDLVEYNKKLNKEWVDIWKDGLEDVREMLADTFVDTFDQIGDKTKSSQDIMKDFFNGIIDSIKRTIAEMMALKLMMAMFGQGFAKGDMSGGWAGALWGIGKGLLSSGAGSYGNAAGTVSSGPTGAAEIGPMAYGGVIDRPTIMVAGERGPEVILPLKRGSARSESSSRGNITVNAVIQTMDAQSFSTFADKNKGVFERQLLTSVSQNPNVRRTLRKYM